MGLFSMLFDNTRNVDTENCYSEINKNIPQKKNKSATTDLNNLVVYAPKDMNEVIRLVDCIKNNETCIVDLSNHIVANREKILNFLSGAICALSGSLSRLQGNLYILTPHNTNIATL